MARGVLRDHEALDAQERHRVALDLRDLDDLEVDAGLAGGIDVPGTGDPVRGLAAREGCVAVSLLILELIRPSLFHLLISGEFLMNTLLSTPTLLGFRRPLEASEDVAAQTREERVHVVRVAAGALLDCEADAAAALLLEGERLLLEVGPALRHLCDPVFTNRPTFSSATGMPYSFP